MLLFSVEWLLWVRVFGVVVLCRVASVSQRVLCVVVLCRVASVSQSVLCRCCSLTSGFCESKYLCVLLFSVEWLL